MSGSEDEGEMMGLVKAYLSGLGLEKTCSALMEEWKGGMSGTERSHQFPLNKLVKWGAIYAKEHGIIVNQESESECTRHQRDEQAQERFSDKEEEGTQEDRRRNRSESPARSLSPARKGRMMDDGDGEEEFDDNAVLDELGLLSDEEEDVKEQDEEPPSPQEGRNGKGNEGLDGGSRTNKVETSGDTDMRDSGPRRQGRGDRDDSRDYQDTHTRRSSGGKGGRLGWDDASHPSDSRRRGGSVGRTSDRRSREPGPRSRDADVRGGTRDDRARYAQGSQKPATDRPRGGVSDRAGGGGRDRRDARGFDSRPMNDRPAGSNWDAFTPSSVGGRDGGKRDDKSPALGEYRDDRKKSPGNFQMDAPRTSPAADREFRESASGERVHGKADGFDKGPMEQGQADKTVYDKGSMLDSSIDQRDSKGMAKDAFREERQRDSPAEPRDTHKTVPRPAKETLWDAREAVRPARDTVITGDVQRESWGSKGGVRDAPREARDGSWGAREAPGDVRAVEACREDKDPREAARGAKEGPRDAHKEAWDVRDGARDARRDGSRDVPRDASMDARDMHWDPSRDAGGRDSARIAPRERGRSAPRNGGSWDARDVPRSDASARPRDAHGRDGQDMHDYKDGARARNDVLGRDGVRDSRDFGGGLRGQSDARLMDPRDAPKRASERDRDRPISQSVPSHPFAPPPGAFAVGPMAYPIVGEGVGGWDVSRQPHPNAVAQWGGPQQRTGSGRRDGDIPGGRERPGGRDGPWGGKSFSSTIAPVQLPERNFREGKVPLPPSPTNPAPLPPPGLPHSMMYFQGADERLAARVPPPPPPLISPPHASAPFMGSTMGRPAREPPRSTVSAVRGEWDKVPGDFGREMDDKGRRGSIAEGSMPGDLRPSVHSRLGDMGRGGGGRYEVPGVPGNAGVPGKPDDGGSYGGSVPPSPQYGELPRGSRFSSAPAGGPRGGSDYPGEAYVDRASANQQEGIAGGQGPIVGYAGDVQQRQRGGENSRFSSSGVGDRDVASEAVRASGRDTFMASAAGPADTADGADLRDRLQRKRKGFPEGEPGDAARSPGPMNASALSAPPMQSPFSSIAVDDGARNGIAQRLTSPRHASGHLHSHAHRNGGGEASRLGPPPSHNGHGSAKKQRGGPEGDRGSFTVTITGVAGEGEWEDDSKGKRKRGGKAGAGARSRGGRR